MTIFKTVTGQGDDVVLFHGAGCNHYHMQPIVDQLSSHYRVTNIDLPGAGQSDWQSSMKTIYDIVDVLLPHLPQQAIYVGWSFGGLLAMATAVKYPDRVKRIVGIGTTPKFIETENWPGFPQPGFKVLFPNMREHGFGNFIKSFCDAEFADIEPKPTAYHELLAWLNDKHHMDVETFAEITEITDATDLRKEFAAFQCRVDLIFGEMDGAVPYPAEIKTLNPNINIHTIPGAHHMPFWTHPKEFNQVLNSIL